MPIGHDKYSLVFTHRPKSRNYSKMKKRYLSNQVVKDLKNKMVFLGGPRQMGKTTLSLSLFSKKSYLNWDSIEDREKILNFTLPAEKTWIFDEIHKYKKWRNCLKGLYDKNKNQQILVTGSARLDLYSYGGESLHDLGTAELVLMRLPDLVGSPLSINSLAKDVQISFKTIKKWLDIYERFYAIFRVSPHLKYLKNKFPEVKSFQLTYRSNKDYLSAEGIRVVDAHKVLGEIIKKVSNCQL